MANLDFSLYKNIIAIPSISSTDPRWDQSNEAVIRLLADWFGQLGFHCEVTALPDLPGKFNLVATHGQGEGTAAGGHTDTVPFDEGPGTRILQGDRGGQPPVWARHHRHEGLLRLYRGGAEGDRSHYLNKPLRILATADEETTMAGPAP